MGHLHGKRVHLRKNPTKQRGFFLRWLFVFVFRNEEAEENPTNFPSFYFSHKNYHRFLSILWTINHQNEAKNKRDEEGGGRTKVLTGKESYSTSLFDALTFLGRWGARGIK